jgi:hypothetical protein
MIMMWTRNTILLQYILYATTTIDNLGGEAPSIVVEHIMMYLGVGWTDVVAIDCHFRLMMIVRPILSLSIVDMMVARFLLSCRLL